MQGKIHMQIQGSWKLLETLFCPCPSFPVGPQLRRRLLGPGEDLCLQTRPDPASSYSVWVRTGSRGEVTKGGTALSQHPEQRKKRKHAKNKALQEHKRFFDGQGHVQGTKVKVIPGTPYCYSYNCLFEFQQIWVSVLKQRQNKLKGSKSKSQQGQYFFFFYIWDKARMFYSQLYHWKKANQKITTEVDVP